MPSCETFRGWWTARSFVSRSEREIDTRDYGIRRQNGAMMNDGGGRFRWINWNSTGYGSFESWHGHGFQRLTCRVGKFGQHDDSVRSCIAEWWHGSHGTLPWVQRMNPIGSGTHYCFCWTLFFLQHDEFCNAETFHKDLSALTSHQMLKNRACGCRLHKHKRLDHQHPASDGRVFMHSVSRLSWVESRTKPFHYAEHIYPMLSRIYDDINSGKKNEVLQQGVKNCAWSLVSRIVISRRPVSNRTCRVVINAVRSMRGPPAWWSIPATRDEFPVSSS